MSLQASGTHHRRLTYNPDCIETIILKLADTCNIQVVWDGDCAMLTGVMALTGGLLGALFGGRSGAAIGAGFGGAAGIGMSQVKPLREVWLEVKEKLKELLYIVYNYLRRLDAEDYVNAFSIVMTCAGNRQELAKIIISFITQKLGREVISNLAIA